MNDSELRHQHSWRFCRIPRGQKGPRIPNWQNTPLLLDQIPSTDNVGLLLGPHSGGIAAVDFDGPWGWQFWDEYIGCSIPNTVAWTSGREGRCQLAFSIPHELWDYVHTHKVSHDGQGFEFRWAGTQSVLPPSIHPTTGAPYFWIAAPSVTSVAPAPIELLEWAVAARSNSAPELPIQPEPQLDQLTDSEFEFTRALLHAIKQRHTTLDYDMWTKVSWACAAVLGRYAAAELLREFWPEQQRGEYNRLFKNYNINRSPKIGTLVTLSGLTTDQWKILKLECELLSTTRRIA